MTEKHGGNILKLAAKAGRPPQDILDFSANINPLGPPEWLRPLISSRVSSLVHYPDPDCTELIRAFARRFGLSPDEIIAGNGSTEILYLLPRVSDASRAVVLVPSYADYATAAELCGLPVEKIPLSGPNGFAPDLEALAGILRDSDLVLIGQPNNPIGCLCDPDAVRNLALGRPCATFVIDESFLPFTEGVQSLMMNRPPNVVVLMSLTKFYAIPGLRLGMAVANRNVIAKLKRLLPPWSVNTLAQAAGTAAMEDTDYAARSRRFVDSERRWLQKELGKISGLKIYPGCANFLLAQITRADMDARKLAGTLLASGIAIRVCDNFDGLDNRYVRIAVRTREDNMLLLAALAGPCGARGKVPPPKKKAKTLMIQGTGSSAGKSILVAALCRILLQDGYRVAPFKAQNMSLNSFVTHDGGEMGRAQAMQALAAKIDPDVRMNPVLLKPAGDMKSQVIVRGRPVGHMDFRNYLAFNPAPFEAAREDFDALGAEYDAVILEGAGSPAEINLKENDIVNMNMALYARSPVLLAGDIDRGGLYASFIGTMETFSEAERKLVAGFLVNRFRGDQSLLAEAHRLIEMWTGRKVLGVIPYLDRLDLPEEDSVGFKEGLTGTSAPLEDSVVVAVVDLPHIANFTDFDALRIEPDVCVRVVRTATDLGEPDAVILPGSKNVPSDLAFLRKTGLDRKILALAENGKTEIIGICGGFQMLGDRIDDPDGMESPAGSTVEGLGLLPVSTRFIPEKTLKRVRARHLPSGLILGGYEIHHGLTDTGNLNPCIRTDEDNVIGLSAREDRIWGTYLHGVFDADEFRRWLVDRLRARCGWPACGKIRAVYDLEPAFERLATAVRESVDMKTIYKIMGIL
ncbi:MAG TPA: cobyric acid synthase [Smithellaceae bacterium]|nr:cobyric acid synthase [Smithellaceae bacterium]